jgi:outer membrane protein
MDQAQLAVKQAELNLLAAEQDLILRVATSYLNFLASNDGVELARAEREATEKQYEQAKSRMDSGLGTIAQVHDMEARLSLTKAREIESENRVDDARLALKEIVGEGVSGVRGFKSDFDPAMPLPSSIESWVEASTEQNLALQGRALAVEIAAMEITRQRAGHLPTVSLVGSMNRLDAGGSLYGDGQLSENAEIGVRFNLPLTDGGMTMSMSREASARKDKAAHEREQEQRRTERLTRSSYNGLVTSAKTLDALRQSVVAQESALETRIEGFNSGLYNVVAVMDAYRLYYTAQRDFFQSRYDYLLNRLKLKQAVGTLSRKDLEDISALMQ